MITVKAVGQGFCPSGFLRNEGDKFQWPEGHVLPRWVEIVPEPFVLREPEGAPEDAPEAEPLQEPDSESAHRRRGRKPKGSVDDLV